MRPKEFMWRCSAPAPSVINGFVLEKMMDEKAVPTDTTETASKGFSGRAKLSILAIAIIGLIILSQTIDVQGMLARALDKIENLGWIGAIVFAVLYVVATVLFLAPAILTVGAGAICGVIKGTILVSVSSMLGASAAFLLGRYFARDLIAAKVEGNPRFQATKDAVSRQGWKIVCLTRLSPIFPFSLLNYMYGLTPISFRHYFFASWIGMLPGTLMYVYLGAAGESLVTLGAEGRERTAGEWILLVVGLAVTVIVTLFVTRIARKALSEAVPSDSQESAA